MWKICGLCQGCFRIENWCQCRGFGSSPSGPSTGDHVEHHPTQCRLWEARQAVRLQGVALALLQLWGCWSVLGFVGPIWHLAVSSGFQEHCWSCPLSPAAPGNWFFPVLPPCMPRQFTGRPGAPCSLLLGTVKEWRMSQQVFPCCPRIFTPVRIEWF